MFSHFPAMPPNGHVEDAIAAETAIGKLPTEIICQIMLNLSFADSLSFARTCSFFYSIFVVGYYHNPTIDNHRAWFCLFKGSISRSLIVQKFLKLDHIDPAIEKKLNETETAIRLASKYGHAEVVRLLLNDPRVDPSAYSNHAIRLASWKGHVEVVKLLLNDPRVDPSDRDNVAIRWASGNGHVEVVKPLLNDPRVDPSADNNCAIRWASRKGHVEVVKILLNDPRVDPSDRDYDAIRSASDNGHVEVVKLLLNDPRVDPCADINEALNSP
jgi:ankyrin repeat protein